MHTQLLINTMQNSSNSTFLRMRNATTGNDADSVQSVVWEQDGPPHPCLVVLLLPATHIFQPNVDYAILVVMEQERERVAVGRHLPAPYPPGPPSMTWSVTPSTAGM